MPRRADVRRHDALRHRGCLYNQVVTGAQRLIELADGWPEEMQYGIHYQDTKHYGIRAQVEWDYPEEPDKEPATVTELKPAIASHEEWK